MHGYPHYQLLALAAQMRGQEYENKDLRRLSNPEILRQIKLVLDGHARIVPEYEGLLGQIPVLKEDLTAPTAADKETRRFMGWE